MHSQGLCVSEVCLGDGIEGFYLSFGIGLDQLFMPAS